MKVLIIYHSEHHGNTKKIAKAMAEKINADILKVADASLNKFEEYDIVGFDDDPVISKMETTVFH